MLLALSTVSEAAETSVNYFTSVLGLSERSSSSPIIIRACYAGMQHAQLNYGLVSTSNLIVTGFGRAVLRPHNRRGPRAPDSDDALGRRDGGGATDLSPVSAGTALLALEFQVRG